MRPPLRRPRRRFVPTLAALSLALLPGAAAATVVPPPPSPKELTAAVRSWRQAHEAEVLGELTALLAIPNLAADDADIRRNAALLVAMLERRGMTARLLESPGSPPAVLGELPAPGATRTVVFYAHYDGQPVDPGEWASPPYRPVLRDGVLGAGGRELPWPGTAPPFDGEWRLYARSASDDKSPIVALLSALDALRAAKIVPSVNLKFFFEGEEEAGSPHLGALLAEHAALLGGDVWLFCDGPVHQSRRPQVVFGVRGVMGLQMTVYGPLRRLHSGHYGNWAPNPAALLVDLVASMRGPDGEIRIAGFSDHVRPLSDADRQALARVPDPDADLRRELGLARSEAGDARLIERILLPAVNVLGLDAGGVGQQTTNSIPTEARAALGFRLVPDQTPDEVRQKVEAHVRARGFWVVADEPDLPTRLAHPRIVRLGWGDGYPAVRTPLDLPVSKAVLAVADAATGGQVIPVPSLGGSLPMYLFAETLHAPLIIVPMVNHDNNQHAANENLRLQNLWAGIELYAALMARLGEAWGK
jgi:acetylornithine deacetylase/succinyl-diaminopimelate desuccinylase-like protein